MWPIAAQSCTRAPNAWQKADGGRVVSPALPPRFQGVLKKEQLYFVNAPCSYRLSRALCVAEDDI